MRPDNRDLGYAWDMLQAARDANSFMSGVAFHQYLSNKMLRKAVERLIEIIGEAAAHTSDGFKESHPEIPWGAVIGQRNVLAHEYGEILEERIYKVATLRIPALITSLENILGK